MLKSAEIRSLFDSKGKQIILKRKERKIFFKQDIDKLYFIEIFKNKYIK
jgi:hypothetical protein